MNELFKHINAFRPQYQQHLVGLPGIDPTDVGAATSTATTATIHVGEVLPDGSRSNVATRDLVWMAMHVIYRVAEFGLWSVNYDQVEPEVLFLNAIVPHAIAVDDFDMLGEVLDCLNSVHVEDNIDTNRRNRKTSSGSRSSHSRRDQILFNVRKGREYLVQEQFVDGSFSVEKEDSNHWHTTHVAGLALLPRPTRRSISTVDAKISNELFWVREMVSACCGGCWWWRGDSLLQIFFV